VLFELSLSIVTAETEPACMQMPSRSCDAFWTACCNTAPHFRFYAGATIQVEQNSIVRTKPWALPRTVGERVSSADIQSSLLHIPLAYCRDQNFLHPWTNAASTPTANPIGALTQARIDDEACGDDTAAFNIAVSATMSSALCNEGVVRPASFRSLLGTYNIFATVLAQCAADFSCTDAQARFVDMARSTDLPGWQGGLSWSPDQIRELELAVSTFAATFQSNDAPRRWGTFTFQPWQPEGQDAHFMACLRSLSRNHAEEIDIWVENRRRLTLATFTIFMRITEHEYNGGIVPTAMESSCPWADVVTGDRKKYQKMGTRIFLKIPAGVHSPLQSLMIDPADDTSVMSNALDLARDFWLLPPDSVPLAVHEGPVDTEQIGEVMGIDLWLIVSPLPGTQNMRAPLTFCTDKTPCTGRCAPYLPYDHNVQYMTKERGVYSAQIPKPNDPACCVCT